MGRFVVVGAGPVGRETARLLAVEGHEVRLVSRTGQGIAGTGVEAVSLDAADGARLAQISAGAESIFMCAMAAYHRWPTDFPPIMSGVVTAAVRTGARLVVLGNVYGYGATAPSPLTPATPLAPTTIKGRVRVAMWEEALRSGLPALEIRASDYIGRDAGSLFTLMTLPPLLAGRPAPVVGDPDALHAWSFTRDVARTLVAASRYPGPWGRAFHVPSQHATVRDLALRFAARARVPSVELQPLTDAQLAALARGDDLLREVVEMAYLFEQPAVLDASETERLLGVVAGGLATAVDDTLQGS